MGNTKSIGIAYSDQDLDGSTTLLCGAYLGYSTSAQGAVTQLTSKSTGVTLNKSAGRITMNNAALAATTSVSFTLTNSFISAKDTLIVTVSGGNASPATYNCWVDSMAAGSCSITLRNVSAGSLSEAIIVNFAIIHCD
jgi:hypothetical protein